MRSPEFLDPDPSEESYEDTETHYEDDEPEEEQAVGEPDPGVEVDAAAEDDNEIPAADTSQAAEPDELEDGTPVHPEGSPQERRWVPLGELHLERKFWKNPRIFTGLEDPDIRALADDIARKTVTDEKNMFAGIDEPLRVVQIKVGRKVEQLVLDGQRRYLATRVAYAGEKQADGVLVPVIDREPEPVEWSQMLAQRYLREVLAIVTLRQGLSAYELSVSAEGLRASNDPNTGTVTTMATIGGIIGRSESWVSKILAARKAAGAKLLERWRNGEISEETFRDLAGVKDKDKQDEHAAKATEARQGGDKGEARRSAKEQKEIARRDAQAKRDKDKADKAAAKAKNKADKQAARDAKKGKKGAAVKEQQQADLPLSAPPTQDPKPAPRPKPMQGVIIDDIVAMSDKKPPTHDLVKGVILGVLVASGRLDMAALPKQWHQYINHATGTKPDRPAKRRKGK